MAFYLPLAKPCNPRSKNNLRICSLTELRSALEKIFDLRSNCTCVSKPITISQFILFILKLCWGSYASPFQFEIYLLLLKSLLTEVSPIICKTEGAPSKLTSSKSAWNRYGKARYLATVNKSAKYSCTLRCFKIYSEIRLCPFPEQEKKGAKVTTFKSRFKITEDQTPTLEA